MDSIYLADRLYKIIRTRQTQIVEIITSNQVKDLWAHLKEWSDWKMKDWIKAAIVAIIVSVIIGAI